MARARARSRRHAGSRAADRRADDPRLRRRARRRGDRRGRALRGTAPWCSTAVEDPAEPRRRGRGLVAPSSATCARPLLLAAACGGVIAAAASAAVAPGRPRRAAAPRLGAGRHGAGASPVAAARAGRRLADRRHRDRRRRTRLPRPVRDPGRSLRRLRRCLGADAADDPEPERRRSRPAGPGGADRGGDTAAIILAAGAIFIGVGGREEDRGDRDRGLQRRSQELCEPASTTSPSGHAQRDVGGDEPRLALRPAGRRTFRPAARRRPRPADRRPLRTADGGRRDRDRPLRVCGDERNKIEHEIGPEAFEAALRLRDQVVNSPPSGDTRWGRRRGRRPRGSAWSGSPCRGRTRPSR